MFSVFVTIEVHAEHLEAFLPRMLQQAEDSIAREPACQTFEVWTSKDLPTTVQLYEVYDDASAFAAHLESDHFKDFDATVAGMIVSKTVLTFDRRL